MAKKNNKINIIRLKVILLIVQVILFVGAIVAGIIIFNVIENANTMPFIIVTIILIPTIVLTLLSLQKDVIKALQDDDIMNGDKEHLKRFMPFIVGKTAAKSPGLEEEDKHKNE